MTIIKKNDARIDALWLFEEASGSRLDYTANDNDLTDNNTVGSSADAQEGSLSADFERSSSEYLSITNAAQTGLNLDTFTICVWLKPESSGVIQYLITKSDESTQQSYELRINSADTIRVRLSGNGTGMTSYDSTGTITAGVWQHLAVVYNKTDVRIYLNGILANTPAARTSTTFDGTAPVRIGTSGSLASFYDGLMDELMMSGDAFSSEEIRAIFHHGIQDVVSEVALQVGASSDDASQITVGANTVINGTSFNMNGSENFFGARFLNVTIPQGATITYAQLELYCTGTTDDDPNVQIYGDDVNDAVTFTTGIDDLYDRTTVATDEFTLWSEAGIATGAGFVGSPSLVSVIQELVDRPGWASGNDMALLLLANVSLSSFEFNTYDSSSAQAPKLTIGYTAAGGNPWYYYAQQH